MRGLLLGLSSGTVCLASCAPVLIPCLLGESRRVRADFVLLGIFLAGRLAGYLAFAVLAWSVGALLRPQPRTFALLIAASYIVLGALMVVFGLDRPPAACPVPAAGRLRRWQALVRPPLLPAVLGLVTGLNVCPPFLLAFAEAAAARTLGASLLFFLAFFLGTSVFFLPFPALGAFRASAALRTVGRLTAVVVGVLYCGMGLGMLR